MPTDNDQSSTESDQYQPLTDGGTDISPDDLQPGAVYQTAGGDRWEIVDRHTADEKDVSDDLVVQAVDVSTVESGHEEVMAVSDILPVVEFVRIGLEPAGVGNISWATAIEYYWGEDARREISSGISAVAGEILSEIEINARLESYGDLKRMVMTIDVHARYGPQYIVTPLIEHGFSVDEVAIGHDELSLGAAPIGEEPDGDGYRIRTSNELPPWPAGKETPPRVKSYLLTTDGWDGGWEQLAAELHENGIPQKRARVVALVAEGHTYSETAEMLGSKNRREVSTHLRRYRGDVSDAQWLLNHGPRL